MTTVLNGVHLAEEDRDHIERWLTSFDVIIPLRPYNELAEQFGDEQERELTKAVVGDLRQPVYDQRMIFTRDNDEGRAFLDAYATEKADCHDDCPLPLLRAIWKTKPFILALPCGWALEGAA